MKRVRMETPKKREERWWLEVFPSIHWTRRSFERGPWPSVGKAAPLGDVGGNR